MEYLTGASPRKGTVGYITVHTIKQGSSILVLDSLTAVIEVYVKVTKEWTLLKVTSINTLKTITRKHN